MDLKHCVSAIGLIIGSACLAQPPTEFDTRVVSEQNAIFQDFEWGTLYRYFDGESLANGHKLAAVAVINPGMEIHPPHEHSDEEYLMVIEGSGTWDVRGKTVEAHSGDILYARPGEMHGVRNTGDTPLKLLIFKWGFKPKSADQ